MVMFKDYPDILTVKQLAEALGIGKNKAYELVNQQAIGTRRIGRRILVPKICLIEYVSAARYAVCNGRQV